MSTQPLLNFDTEAGERAKNIGIDLAQSGHVFIRTARALAISIAKLRGTVTADDVQKGLLDLGLPLLGNAAGGLFRGTEWEFTGEWRASERESNHGHRNRVWRLK